MIPRLLLLAALILAVPAACCHRGPEPPRSSFPTHAYQATASITNAKGRIGGAAVVLRCRTGWPLIVLTADHVATVPGPLFAKLDGTRQPLKVYKRDQAHDLALMVGPKQPAACREAVLGDSAKVGDPIWVIGSPVARHRLVSRGIISGTSRRGTTLRYWSDAAGYSGSSGGGAWDRQGRLVGVVVGGLYQTWGPLRIRIPASTVIVHTRHLFELVKGAM